MRFIDSHVHLADYADSEGTLRFARFNQMLLLSSSVDRRTSDATLALAARDANTIKAFVGVHPSEAGKDDLSWFGEAFSRASGAGEVGLDPKYSQVTAGSHQLAAFRAQLSEVEGARKPVQVHSRGAARECIEELSTYNLGAVLMHWFEDEAFLKVLGDKGYFVSFGPALLYSKKLQRMARSYDPVLVLTETDGPVEFGPLGRAQGPSLVPSVAFKLSELWQRSYEDVLEDLVQNGLRYLNVPEKA
ncbi:MAG: TatD family hydrolase [Thaumarchaeota archaeon]|nr:TatD family hydrolase [Nitrososphaerota archaeon]